MINQFNGRFAFLSNIHPSPITWENITYPTVEHAFQAAKSEDPAIRQQIADMDTPDKAKQAGGRRGIVKTFAQPAWERKKLQVMERLLRLKFQDTELAAKLKETGDQQLIEGNNWNDTFWGVRLNTGKGRNHLGRILMKIRAEI
jgi:ribA/ribD-fused uncharacterized protein